MGADVARLERKPYEPPRMFDAERGMPRGTLRTTTHDADGWRRFHEEHARAEGEGWLPEWFGRAA